MLDFLLRGVENTYKDGSTDGGTRAVVNQSVFNQISSRKIFIPKGSYALHYDSSMQYKKNAFYSDRSLFYNPIIKTEIVLSQHKSINQDRLFDSRSFFSSFCA